jgi:hypothetical protein
MTRHRKDRGFRTERVVAGYLQTWWRSASVGRGAGKDIHNVPFDIEVKARAELQAPRVVASGYQEVRPQRAVGRGGAM